MDVEGRRAEPDLRWLWVALGGALAIALFAGGGIWLLSAPPDDEPVPATSPSSSAPASPSPSPVESAPAPVVETAPAPVGARCWDSSTAATVEECSMPDGAAGLAWVFPQLSGQQCRPASTGGEPGVVVRVLCSAVLPDGTTVKLGYYQWDSVDTALAYYDAQGMRRNEVGQFHTWTARLGNRTKKAVLYADAPYSRTLLFRTSAAYSPELQRIGPRPPDELRGTAAG